MTTPAKRTRTGCKTCRQRKLKCDEVKPVCGQCHKSSRECHPSEGIAFRHAQNAGFSESEGGQDLASFYKYRQKFQNTYFLPVPRELSFVQVTDPYASEDPAPQSPLQPLPQLQSSQYAYPLQHDPQYVDVATSSLKAMIDPSLEDETNNMNKDHGDLAHGLSLGTTGEISDADNINETIMKALRNTDEQGKVYTE